MSRRERAQSAKTLICLLQSLSGRETKVELRDDTYLVGRIVTVDGYMNVEMEEVVLHAQDRQEHFEYFFLKGPKIRYVTIPDDVNVLECIESQLDMIQAPGRTVRSQKMSQREPKGRTPSDKRDN